MTQKNELDGYAAIGGKVMTKKNLRIDNTMVKRKRTEGQTTIYKTLDR
jgi:hypothetical protein